MNLFSIGSKMQQAGLSPKLISMAIGTALEYEGVADLIFLWDEEEDINERNEIISDIQELIEDCR